MRSAGLSPISADKLETSTSMTGTALLVFDKNRVELVKLLTVCRPDDQVGYDLSS
jgi:hypothetical protein